MTYFPAFDERVERMFHKRSNKAGLSEWKQSSVFMKVHEEKEEEEEVEEQQQQSARGAKIISV